MEKRYLIKVFNSVNAKNHFITDLINAIDETELEKKAIGKVYYKDSDRKNVLSTCRKIEIVHIIQ